MIGRNKNKIILLFVAVAFALPIVLRLGLYFFRRNGFSGLSILTPILLLCVCIFGFCMSLCFALWVYEDCKRRGDDGLLWAVVVFIATPFIALVIYFLRRLEVKKVCKECGHKIAMKAKYCEECGTYNWDEEENESMKRKETHHIPLLVVGNISMVLMIVCLIGFIVSAATEVNINTNVASNERVWNFGVIQMSYTSYHNGIWDFNAKRATHGYVKEQNMTIKDSEQQMLYADISCGKVPEGATLMLWLVQGDVVESFDVTNLSKPLEYSLSKFENGKIHVRLQINGVESITSKIFIQ